MSDLTFKGAAATRGGRWLLNAPGCAPASPGSRLKCNLSVSPPLHAAFPLIRLLNQVAPRWRWQPAGLPVLGDDMAGDSQFHDRGRGLVGSAG